MHKKQDLCPHPTLSEALRTGRMPSFSNRMSLLSDALAPHTSKFLVVLFHLFIQNDPVFLNPSGEQGLDSGGNSQPLWLPVILYGVMNGSVPLPFPYTYIPVFPLKLICSKYEFEGLDPPSKLVLLPLFLGCAKYHFMGQVLAFVSCLLQSPTCCLGLALLTGSSISWD